jgi:hypothetical protein
MVNRTPGPAVESSAGRLTCAGDVAGRSGLAASPSSLGERARRAPAPAVDSLLGCRDAPEYAGRASGGDFGSPAADLVNGSFHQVSLRNLPINGSSTAIEEPARRHHFRARNALCRGYGFRHWARHVEAVPEHRCRAAFIGPCKRSSRPCNSRTPDSRRSRVSRSPWKGRHRQTCAPAG